MTQPKPAGAIEPLQEDAPAAQPLQFAPAKTSSPSLPPAPSLATPAPAQPVQFAPARQPSPGPALAPHDAPPPKGTATVSRARRMGFARFLLLVVIPLVALTGGVFWWLNSGRYVTTDNAYVGSQKVLITPQVSGPIVAIHVVEGQKVKAGDPLFDIDPEPFKIALALAQGRLDAAKVESTICGPRS